MHESDRDPVDMATYISQIVRPLWRTHNIKPGRITRRVNVQDITLAAAAAVPCGLIIHELVSNALQHAFPDGRSGAVYVGLHEVREHYKLVVRDDGVGLPADLDIQYPESPGLAQVRTLVEELEGKIAWETRTGTRVQITFAAPRFQEES
jgi:two-component sensor histidine kinase